MASIWELARCLLPSPIESGDILVMLNLYFDDSGTHSGSQIVVSAGLGGTVEQWGKFESALAVELTAPEFNRPALSRFHMSDCQNAHEEYTGWTRAESENHQNKICNMILDCGLIGYGVSTDRGNWDKWIKGRLRLAHGDAEEFCISNAVFSSLKHLKNLTQEREYSLVIDQRTPAVNVYTGRIYEALKPGLNGEPDPAKLVAFAISDSFNTKPLQAADYFANLTYQFGKQLLGQTYHYALAPQWERLIQSGKFTIQYADEPAIQRIAARSIPDANLDEIIKEMRG